MYSIMIVFDGMGTCMPVKAEEIALKFEEFYIERKRERDRMYGTMC